MKLLLDEMHSPAVAAMLRDWGHGAVAVTRCPDLAGLPDKALLQKATADGRALVTENIRHFVSLSRQTLAAGQRHAGLIFTHSRRFPRDAPNQARVLADALAALLTEHGATLSQAESFVWWLERRA